MSGVYDSVGGGRIKVDCEKRGPEPCGCSFTVVPVSPPAPPIPLFVSATLVVLAALCLFSLNVFSFLSLLLLALFVFVRLNAVKEETVLLIPTVGLQYTKKFVSGYQTEVFVHWLDINNIIINEVIYRQKIIYLLTVIINDSEKQNVLLPLFVGTLPRLKCLEILYQEFVNILEKC